MSNRWRGLLLLPFLIITVLGASEEPVLFNNAFGLTPDRSLIGDTQENSWYMFTSYVTLERAPSDEELSKMAVDAFHIMRSEKETGWSNKKQRPTVVTALSIGNDVYFATSAKGGQSLVYLQSWYPDIEGNGDGRFRDHVHEDIKAALIASRTSAIQSRNEQHVNNAQCGEVMTAWTWLLQHPGQHIQDQNPQPRAVTWWKQGHKNPCEGTDSADGKPFWGCNKVVEALEVRFLDAINEEDLPDTYPEVLEKHQQQLNACELPIDGGDDSDE